MAIKGKLDKETYNSLDTSLKGLYKESGDAFILDIDDMQHEDDIKALKNAKNEESKIAKELRALNMSLEDKLKKLEQSSSTKDKTVEETVADYELKIAALAKQNEDTLSSINNKYKNTLLDKEAEILSKELFTVPKIALPHLKSRLSVEDTENGLQIRVLDSSGQVTKKTLDDLKKEIIDNPEYKSIIKGNQASGGATTPNNSGANVEVKPMREMNAAEKLAHLQGKGLIAT